MFAERLWFRWFEVSGEGARGRAEGITVFVCEREGLFGVAGYGEGSVVVFLGAD